MHAISSRPFRIASEYFDVIELICTIYGIYAFEIWQRANDKKLEEFFKESHAIFHKILFRLVPVISLHV